VKPPPATQAIISTTNEREGDVVLSHYDVSLYQGFTNSTRKALMVARAACISRTLERTKHSDTKYAVTHGRTAMSLKHDKRASFSK